MYFNILIVAYHPLKILKVRASDGAQPKQHRLK